MHEIRDDSGIVPDIGILGVGGILANLLIGVTESATDGFGETNLLTRIKEVLTGEDILWCELTEVFL